MADVELRWEKTAEFVSSLRDNFLESRISFVVRLEDRRRTPIPFLEETVAVERKEDRSAYYDFLENKFVVESDSKQRLIYDGSLEFLAAFLTWRNVELPMTPALRSPRVSARVQFDPVRLAPPLTLVSLVGDSGTYASPWVHAEVP